MTEAEPPLTNVEPIPLPEGEEVFDLITRSQLGQRNPLEPETLAQQQAHRAIYRFSRLLEAQVQLDVIREWLNLNERGVEPEQVKAVGEVQQILSGATDGAYRGIRSTGDLRTLNSAQSWLDHLREIRAGRREIVLFPSRDPINVKGMLDSFITADAAKAGRRGYRQPLD